MSYEIIHNKDGSYTYYYNAEYTCSNGKVMSGFKLTFETHGNKNKPIILINHALSSSYHVKSTELNPNKGWWENNIGPRKCLDTEKYYIICIGNLGSFTNCTNAKNHIPQLTVNDIAKTQLMVLEALGINNVEAIVGNSMGAYISTILAIHLGNRVNKLISISSALKSYPTNKIIHELQKDIISLNPNWKTENNSKSMITARKIGLLSYFNTNYINNRFNCENELSNYLTYNAEKFAQQTSPEIYLHNLSTMDEFDIANYFVSYTEAFEKIKAKCLIVGVRSDTLTPIQQQQELHDHLIQAGANSKILFSSSPKGHDAFYSDNEIAQFIKDHLD